MPDKLIISVQKTPRRFLRSTDIVRDFHDPKSLQDFWLTDFCRTCLEQISDGFRLDSGRRAWRLTGDFGSGKSSFALLLATALRDTKDLPTSLRSRVQEAMPTTKHKKFLPVLVSGKRESVALEVLNALFTMLSAEYTRGAKAPLLAEMEEALDSGRISDQKVIEYINEANRKIIHDKKGDGILLIIDEAGKFLEFAAFYPDKQDVFFFQQLAENASRSGKYPLIVLCLFHQGFSAYADQLVKTTQQEWNKIAGRYDEIVFHQPLDQIALLIAAALGTDIEKLPKKANEQARESMMQAINLGWYGTSSSRNTLRSVYAKLFPIDPMLLPVLMRFFRRFGQNERSVFSFLFSHEPYGLHAFSAREILSDDPNTYGLAEFYDYIRTNFGYRLGTASYRTHWNVIENTIEAYHSDHPLDIRVLKTVGMLNLLSADEFAPTEDAICWAVAGCTETKQKEVQDSLRRITARKALFFRGKGRGYSIWAHTSIDLDERFEAAKIALPSVGSVSSVIKESLPDNPIVARAHYIKTGNLRFFDVIYCQSDELSNVANSYLSKADGFILVPLCETQEESKRCVTIAKALERRTDAIRLVAVPQPLTSLQHTILDVQRWEWIQANTLGLNNDILAREEVKIYLQEARRRLQSQVQTYLGISKYSGESTLHWFYHDHEGKFFSKSLSSREIMEQLSYLCDAYFSLAPTIKNELVNRMNISSAAAGARIRLIELMLTSSGQADLGMPADRKPPEKSMYYSVVKQSGVHRQEKGIWKIAVPSSGMDPCKLLPALTKIKELLETHHDTRIAVSDMMKELRLPPYGLRDGLFPILLAIIAIENEYELAFYENGTFLRELGRDGFLRMIKAPDKFDIQLCRIEGVRASLFMTLAETLEIVTTKRHVVLLDIVRNLCQFVAKLPEYSRNTKRLTPVANSVREVILQAREPVRMVFHDLPEACGFNKFDARKALSNDDAKRFVLKLKEALDEIRDVYPFLQQRIERAIAKEMGYPGSMLKQFRHPLAERAERLIVRVTDNKLKAFVFRLFDETLSESDWLSSMGSVLALKPPDKWKDEDEATFERELESLAGRFARAESIAFSAGTAGYGVRIAVTRADGSERQEVVQIDEKDKQYLSALQLQIAKLIEENPRLGLAAASQAIWSQLKKDEE